MLAFRFSDFQFGCPTLADLCHSRACRCICPFCFLECAVRGCAALANAVVPRSRLIPRSPRPVLTRASLFERLAAVRVESPPNDDIRGVRGPLGSLFARESSVCGDGAVRFVEAGGGF